VARSKTYWNWQRARIERFYSLLQSKTEPTDTDIPYVYFETATLLKNAYNFSKLSTKDPNIRRLVPPPVYVRKDHDVPCELFTAEEKQEEEKRQQPVEETAGEEKQQQPVVEHTHSTPLQSDQSQLQSSQTETEVEKIQTIETLAEQAVARTSPESHWDVVMQDTWWTKELQRQQEELRRRSHSPLQAINERERLMRNLRREPSRRLSGARLPVVAGDKIVPLSSSSQRLLRLLLNVLFFVGLAALLLSLVPPVSG
jgi:hypothetical protein